MGDYSSWQQGTSGHALGGVAGAKEHPHHSISLHYDDGNEWVVDSARARARFAREGALKAKRPIQAFTIRREDFPFRKGTVPLRKKGNVPFRKGNVPFMLEEEGKRPNGRRPWPS